MTWLHSKVPRRIVADGLEVRCYEITDASALSEAIASSLPELKQWMPWAKFEPQTLEQRAVLIDTWLQDWDKGLDFVMGIFLDGALVGSSGLHLRGQVGQMEIGYWVRTDVVGQGIATRTSRMLTDTAFSLLEVNEVQILHDKANVSSRRIPEKLGYELLREQTREPQATRDSGIACLWSMTRERWESL